MRLTFLSLGSIIGYMASEFHHELGIFVVFAIAVITVIAFVMKEWRP